jgi:hypothetical protein
VSENGKVSITRDSVASIDDLKRQWVDIPEWGGGCYVRGLTALERTKLERSMVDSRGNPNMGGLDYLRVRLVLYSAINDDGIRIFKDADQSLIEGKSIQAVERIANVAARLSGLDAQAVAELTGKSDTTPNDDSPSG